MNSIKVLALCLALGLVAFVNAAGSAQTTQHRSEADRTHASRHADCPCCAMKHASHQQHTAAQTTGQATQAKTDADGCCTDCQHDGASCCSAHHEGQKTDGACANCKMGAHKSDRKTAATGAAADASCCKMHGAAGHDHAAATSGGDHKAMHDSHADTAAGGCCCAAGDSCPLKKTEGR
ncbi:MAG: hypothetical protein LC785_06345 [Acidobacteria bacterium]|nr:hypothetical protein [Acidobacteriota bacterium]MCA1641564.1 hypothetical protein [Acidobacteriota bacterium]